MQLKHDHSHAYRYYTVPLEVKKQLFQYGGLPKYFDEQTKTFMETCIMVREPALEILHYLRTTDYTRPAVRYVICILFVLWQFYFKSVSFIKSRIQYYIHCGMWKVSEDILVTLHLCVDLMSSFSGTNLLFPKLISTACVRWHRILSSPV